MKYNTYHADVLGQQVQNAWELHAGNISMVLFTKDAGDKATVLEQLNTTISSLKDRDKEMEKRNANKM